MNESPDTAPGVLSLARPITLPDGARTTELFCSRWRFVSEQAWGFEDGRAWVALAVGPPKPDPARAGFSNADVLALIPSANIVGFVRCDRPDGHLQEILCNLDPLPPKPAALTVAAPSN